VGEVVAVAEGNRDDAGILFEAVSDTAFGGVEPGVIDSSGLADSLDVAAAPPDTIRYAAEIIDFDLPNGVVQLRRQADLRYGPYHLQADSVQVETERNLLTAQGETVLEDGEGRLIGDRAILDVESERGRVDNGITAMEDGIYAGEEIRRVGRKYLDVDCGDFTTCRLEHPHYSFWSAKARIEEDELAVARPLVVRVAEVPVFYLPYFVLSLRHGRHSGLLVPSLEKDAVAGRYLRGVGYYCAPNEHVDWMNRVDLYRTGRFRLESVARLAWRYHVPASSLRWIETHNPDTDRVSSDLQLTHNQNFADGTRLRINSSARRTSHNEDLQRTWSGSLSLSHTFEELGSATLSMRSNRDFETGRIVEEMPTLSFRSEWWSLFPESSDLDPGPWASPEDSLAALEGPAWYRTVGFSYTGTASHERNFNAGSAVVNSAVDHRVTLSARGLRFFDGITVAPSLILAESWFDRYRDRQNDRVIEAWKARHTWQASASVSTSIAGVYRPSIGRLSGVMHAIEPKLSFFYTPDFDQYFQEVDGSRLDIFSGLGSSSTPTERRTLSYSLGNRLEVKWRDAEGSEERINLLSLQASGTYDDLRDVRHDLPGEQHFSNIGLSSRLAPSPNYGMQMSMPYDPYERERGTLTISFDARRSSRTSGSQEVAADTTATSPQAAEPLSERQKLFANDPYAKLSAGGWNASLHGTWTLPKSGDASLRINTALGFSPTPKWAVDYRASFNLSEGRRESQFVTVRRDLHCWAGSFRWSESSGHWSYYIEVRLKDLPDVKLEDREYGWNR
jgi:hypothetical protein